MTVHPLRKADNPAGNRIWRHARFDAISGDLGSLAMGRIRKQRNGLTAGAPCIVEMYRGQNASALDEPE